MNKTVTTHQVSITSGLPKSTMTKTLVQNDGFQTLTISRQYQFKQLNHGGENVADFITTVADIFVQDIDKVCLPEEVVRYGNIFERGHFFKSLKHAMNALPRKLQTADFRGREHILQLVEGRDGSVQVFAL